MYLAVNNTTNNEYKVSNEKKEAIEKDPYLRGKYSFKKIADNPVTEKVSAKKKQATKES